PSLGEAPHPTELLVAADDSLLGAEAAHLVERPRQRLAEQLGGPVRVGMRALARLLHDAVDDADLEQLGRRDPERLGGAVRLAGVLPEDGRAPFGRDHRVDRVLEHLYPVADADRERAARAALARDRAD